MDDIKAKQQVVEKIKEASKILVTVSNSPSVDALSAALGLTLLFEKQEKYATAIFSGDVPPAISFLQPEKTFDATTDSLRDFIIALDKEKADHLRMPKPEPGDDMVRIYVTPYKTTITQDDLQFSQGDYNVELVIALGVDKQEHLDKALESHGKILHDATVITVSAGDQTSDLGGVDWHDASASSLSEMITGLAEALKDDKKKPLIDAPIATALLTGIVAETDRFSNQHTTSKAMTVAAQLMSAGADQQLISTELQKSNLPVDETDESTEGESEAKKEEGDNTSEIADDDTQDGSSIKNNEISINHKETLAELDERVREKHEDEPEEEKVEEPQESEETSTDETPEAEPETETTEDKPEEPQSEAAEPVEENTKEPASELIQSTAPAPASKAEVPVLPSIPDSPVSTAIGNVYSPDENEEEPSFGGTLNATSEQAAEDSRREALSDQNKTILSHAYAGGSQTGQISNPLDAAPTGFPGTPSSAPGSVGVNDVEEGLHAAYAAVEPEPAASLTSAPTFGIAGEKVLAPLSPIPSAPVAPTDFGLPLPPPLPDFSQVTGLPPSPLESVFPADSSSAPKPEILGDILAPETPAAGTAYSLEPIETPVKPVPPTDPGQFRIPG